LLCLPPLGGRETLNTRNLSQMQPENLSAFMFINFEQALGFGHIAWGFELAPGQYFYGSTDHLLRRPMWDLIALVGYSRVAPGGDIDYWSGLGSFDQMLAEMSHGPHIRYHAYKQLPVAMIDAAPLQAKALAESLKGGGWTLWDNNCVHQTHAILETFGAGALLSKPMQALIPVKFFARAQAVACELGEANVTLRSCL
jgi:hypothetical protein